MTWHDLIRQARERANLSQAELAEKVGCSQATINKIENEKPQSSKFLLEIINQLGLSGADFPGEAFGNAQNLASGELMVRRSHRSSPSSPSSSHKKGSDPSIWAAEENLIGEIPIYAPVQLVDEIYVIDKILLGSTKRPPFLQGVTGAYAISTDDERMSPECEPGDVLYVNPRQVIPSGSLCVLYCFDAEELFVDIKRYIGITEKNWKTAQHNPPKEIEYERDIWTVRHRVVGKIFR